VGKLRIDREGWIVAVLFLGTVLSRVPFRSQVLYHWDSVNFAFAMRRFDVAADQPQPPGYILYVWLCRLVDYLFHDPQTTMVWISIVASGLAVGVLYLLGREMWDWRVGLLGALFLASSPLFWFYGEIALPHAFDLLLVLVVVWLLYRVWKGENWLLWAAIVVLGVAGGVRQQTLVFLLPLALYATWQAGWKRLLPAGLLGIAICLAWFVPLAASCGGLGAYLTRMSEFSEYYQQGTSVIMGAGWLGVAYNARKIVLYTLYGGAAALVPAGVYLMARVTRLAWPQQWGRLIFLAFWAVPALSFYVLIHMGQQGLIFIFLPVLLVAGAVGLARLVGPRWVWVAAALLVLVNAAVFCLAPEYPLGLGGQRVLTRAALVSTDRYYLGRMAAVQKAFPPQHTAIVAVRWHHLEYYLPGYSLLRLDHGPPNQPRVLTPRQWPGEDGELSVDDLGLVPNSSGKVAVILFDDEIAAHYRLLSPPEAVSLPGGQRLEVLWLGTRDRLKYQAGSLEVVKR